MGVDQQTHEVVFSLGSRWETDLDLLESHIDQKAKHLFFFIDTHWCNERLVAVTQINAAPEGGSHYCTRRPFPVSQIDSWIRSVLMHRHSIHGTPPNKKSRGCRARGLCNEYFIF